MIIFHIFKLSNNLIRIIKLSFANSSVTINESVILIIYLLDCEGKPLKAKHYRNFSDGR